MRWLDPFSNDWRTGATFVHDWFAFGIWICGDRAHPVRARATRPRSTAMMRGHGHRPLGARRAARWFREVTGRPTTDETIADREDPVGSARRVTDAATDPAPRRAAARPTAASARARRRCATRRSPRSPRPRPGYLGTSHRKPACARSSAASAPACASCSRCPTATRCCSATAARPRSGTRPSFGLVERRSQHLVFGEFSSKFAAVTRGRAPPRRRPSRARVARRAPTRSRSPTPTSTRTPSPTTRPRPA